VRVDLTILGSGTIAPHPLRGPAGYALTMEEPRETLLLDPGPGTIRRLAPCGIDLEEVRRIFVTHFHPDHCLDLLAILFARRIPRFEGLPELEIVGPQGLARLLEAARGMFGGWIADPRATVREVGEGEHSFGRFILRAAPTHHTPHALAYRFEFAEGPSFAYTGDTDVQASVVEIARGVDLFLCECSFPDDAPVPGHLTPSRAAALARDAGARRVLLTHFYPECDGVDLRAAARRAFSGEVWLASEGDRFSI